MKKPRIITDPKRNFTRHRDGMIAAAVEIMVEEQGEDETAKALGEFLRRAKAKLQPKRVVDSQDETN